MQITFKLEVHTEQKSGGSGKTIPMFKREIVLTSLTGKQLWWWVVESSIKVDGETFRAETFDIIDDEKCICECSDTIHTRQGRDNNVRFYQTLIRTGWAPCIENTEAIQDEGYTHFKPELFS